MNKVYTINTDDLMYESPETNYDIGSSGHSFTISKPDKKDFLNEMAKWFRNRVSDLLEEEYQCENCEEIHIEQEDIYKCKNCEKEICETCCNVNNKELCEDCEDD